MHLFRKIAVILLSALTLTFSGGVTIAKHYCKAELIDLAINAPVKKCKGAENNAKAPTNGESSFTKQSCCTDVIASFQTNTFQKGSNALLDHVEVPTLTSEICIAEVLNHPQPKTNIQDHAPPLSKQLSYQIYERYLI